MTARISNIKPGANVTVKKTWNSIFLDKISCCCYNFRSTEPGFDSEVTEIIILCRTERMSSHLGTDRRETLVHSQLLSSSL